MRVNNLPESAMTGAALPTSELCRDFWSEDQIGNIDAPDWIPTGSHVGRVSSELVLADIYFVYGENLRGY